MKKWQLEYFPARARLGRYMGGNRTDRTFHSEVADGDVFVETIRPEKPNGETVLILHGLGDHFGRHEWAVSLLTQQGYSVIGLDWPGNGRSEGTRGDLPPTRLIDGFLEEILSREEVFPTGILAHSTGGFFLIHSWAETVPSFRDVEWVWLSSPLLRPDHDQSGWKIWVAKKLAKLIPQFTLSTGVHPSDCYHVAPGEDPVYFREGSHNRISVRAGLDLILAGEKMDDPQYARISEVPLLITQGTDDTVCPPQFAEEFFHRLPNDKATLMLIGGARHEPFRESNRAGMLSGARAWLSLQKK
ncbi:lysophospholipase [Verrucomicrobiales bacterium]|nr:lysophospholipase [Verrucomicrobiales bacterium]